MSDVDVVERRLGEMASDLAEVKALLERLVAVGTDREWYTTEEFAARISKAEATVREHCRYGRLNAERRRSGRGAYPAWVLSHAELLRYQRDGLLPDARLAAAVN